jgi:hypothetical protein
MLPYSYTAEKMSSAVRILAVGKGEARSRLWPAFLEFHPLTVEDFPENLRCDFEWIMHELTKREV